MEGKKKRERERKVERGKVSFYVCVRVGGHLSWSRGVERGCAKTRTLMGKTFGLPENRDYFSLLPTLARKAKFPPFLHY